MTRAFLPALTAVTLLALPAFAAPTLKVEVEGIAGDAMIPDEFSGCVPDASEHSRPGQNRQPQVSWSAGPEGTKSYAVIMSDPDVPTVFDDANAEGKTLPSDMKRREYTHWIVTDIPATQTSFAANSEGNEAVRYQGPCPPWNDLRLHHYRFVVYALDVPSVSLPAKPEAGDARAAMRGHILADGTLTGTYSQNPELRR